MFKVLTILCLALVAVAAAYDFKDALFNQELLEDYKALKPYTIFRQRRHSHGEAGGKDSPRHGDIVNSEKYFNCCEATKPNLSYFDSIKQIKRECGIKIRANSSTDVHNLDPFNCEQMEKVKELIFCESECAAKSLGQLDQQGNYNSQEFKLALKKRFPEADEATQKRLDSYVDKCLDKIKDLDLKPKNKCNRTPLELRHCMFTEMVLGCPAELQIKSKRCDGFRESFSKGKISSLNSQSLHEFILRDGHHNKK